MTSVKDGGFYAWPNSYYGHGVTESLTTDLSRIGGSFVIARDTASIARTNVARSIRARGDEVTAHDG